MEAERVLDGLVVCKNGNFLNPTNDKFSMALNSPIYVDKSELISFTNRAVATEQRYLCVSRPSLDKPALLAELKWDKSAEGAVGRIKKKRYVKALEAYKGNILLVRINYSKKTRKHECKIEPYKI